jgi:hypothetical protein
MGRSFASASPSELDEQLGRHGLAALLNVPVMGGWGLVTPLQWLLMSRRAVLNSTL